MARFLLNHESDLRDTGSRPAYTTVLDYLRSCGLAGTKEGCATGDCGACTAVIAKRTRAGSLQYTARNTCITLLPALHGSQLITVEGLAQPDGKLHAVQQAMAKQHGSQCGFCTPGFVMSLFAHVKAKGARNRQAIVDRLAGNLCRCTGYRPIIDAGMSLSSQAYQDSFAKQAAATAKRLHATARTPNTTAGFAAPSSVAALAQQLMRKKSAHIVAGSTDYSLSVTQDLTQPAELIDVSNIDAMKKIRTHKHSWEIGAGANYESCTDVLGDQLAGFKELMHRFGSPQIRAWATVGGNIANASPVADGPPVFMALDGILTLQRGSKTRSIALADFYTGYRKTVLAPGEFIRSLRIAKPDSSDLFAVHKVSKRIDDDIAAVCAAYCIRIRKAVITRARVAYGGMAATPMRATHCEQALVGKSWSAATIASAADALAHDYQPISDARASASYRQTVAANLLWRSYYASQGKRVALAA